jgi:predicted ester cyclase
MDNESLIKAANDSLITKGEIDLVDQFFTAEYVAHEEGHDHRGHEYIKQYLQSLRKAITDVKVDDVEILSNAGDRITWRRKASGIHDHDLAGIPATGKPVHWEDMIVSRIDGGKIAEEWGVSDLVGRLLMHLPKK